MMWTKRRSWIQLALAQAAGALGLPATSNEQNHSFEKDPFALGVASGSPTAQSVVLWTKLIPLNPLRNPWDETPINVRWEMALDEQFSTVVRSGSAVAPPELAHSVHVEPADLVPNQHYFYRFTVASFTSPVGKTRTAPAKNAEVSSLRFAFATCQRFHSGYFTAYQQMLADKPDLVVFLGDYIYEMGAGFSEVRGAAMRPATALAHYRDLYQMAEADPLLQAMHAECPWLVIWDDHEVLNDYAGAPVRAGAGGRVARAMAAGYQAWFEHMPVSPRILTQGVEGLVKSNAETRIYGSFAWGALAQFHLFDTRQYRDAHVVCGVAGGFNPDTCADWQNASRSMLGAQQELWFAQTTGASASKNWNVIVQSTVMSQYRIPLLGGVAWNDCWEGYPVSRTKLLEALKRNKTANPIMLGGDIHQNWVSPVGLEQDGRKELIAPEFCVTSLTTRSIGSFTAQEMMALCPDCVYTDRHQRGYAMATLTKDDFKVELRVLGATAKPDSVVSTIASFVVKSGYPQILKTA